jgi:peptidoglycan/LPS O-acetylase OafA/YrhL
MLTTNSHRSFFREDIQCLRGLSVLAVIFFHLPQVLFPGGYLGVDVFFVISGYVITGSIYREIQTTGNFSLIGFYKRRFNRLYPALLGVIAVTLIGANYIVPLYDNGKILNTGALALVGLSNNFLFSSSQDYFNLTTKLNPFLHTWSLGIEEQFYVAFSALISFLLWVRARKARMNTDLFSWIATLGALSFFFFARQILWQGAYGQAFYLLPARAWQLALGAIGCLLGTKWTPNFYQKAIAIVGLVCVFVAADQNLIAIFPTLEVTFRVVTSICGFVLCLPADASSSPLRFRNLFTPIKSTFLFIGDKSYSIYLVHWPLISLGYWGYPDLISHSAFILSSSLALGWLSWRIFEQSNLFGKRFLVPLPFAIIAVVSTVATFTDALPGLKTLAHAFTSQQDLAWADTQSSVDAQLGLHSCTDDVLKKWPGSLCKKLFKDDDPKSRHATIYLFGDSHAEHLLWGVHKYAEEFGYNIVVLDSRFPFADVSLHVDRQPPLRYLIKHIRSSPSQPTDLEMIRSIFKTRDLLVFSSFSSRTLDVIKESVVFPVDAKTNDILTPPQVFQKAQAEFLSFLTALPEKIKVLVVLDNPILKAYPGTCLRDPMKCRISRAELNGQRQKVTRLYKSFASQSPKVRLVDLTPFLCDAKSCDLLTAEGQYLYRDDNHLAPAGGMSFYGAAKQLN